MTSGMLISVRRIATIRYDPVKLERAAKALGTKGIRPTVEAALDEVLRLESWKELKELAADGAFELSSEEVRAQAWRE
jgi:Arc/MetJ family transcription regulator